jgi:hypothetical protein
VRRIQTFTDGEVPLRGDALWYRGILTWTVDGTPIEDAGKPVQGTQRSERPYSSGGTNKRREGMSSTKKTARIAGVLYLVNGVTGFFSIIYVPTKLIVYGNAAATAKNILVPRGFSASASSPN